MEIDPDFNGGPAFEDKWLERRFWDFLEFLILYSTLIPISLYVTVEVQKFAGAALIQWDRTMYDADLDEPVQARCSDINEDLGQIEYIFADKTGTLTQNVMVFKKCSVLGTLFSYCHQTGHLFHGERMGNDADLVKREEQDDIRDFFLALALCNTVTVTVTELDNQQPNTGTGRFSYHYASTSPDEEALVQVTGCVGLRLIYRALNYIDIEETTNGGVETETETETETEAMATKQRYRLVNHTFEHRAPFFQNGAKSGFEMCFGPSTPGAGAKTRLESGKTKFIPHFICRLLHVCQFNSTRMRMSVLVQDEKGQIWLFCKGADSMVLPRTKRSVVTTTQAADIEQETDTETRVRRRTSDHLHRFSREGLRTLVVAKKKFSSEEAAQMLRNIEYAEKLIEGRGQALAELYDGLEQNMDFLGVSAVEDKLQEDVAPTMQLLRDAGCRLWVLTGDKVETAMNISLSVGHTTSDMKLLMAVGLEHKLECTRILKEYLDEVRCDKLEHSLPKKRTRRKRATNTSAQMGGRWTPAADRQTGKYGHALVLDGKTMAVALEHCRPVLRELACECVSVLGCRLAPIQKARTVRMIKEPPAPKEPGWFCARKGRSPVTLAIGDGANDVAMIREAHVGVAILGKEGRQAARSSDYSFGKFKFLSRLILVHGHYNYYRISYTIHYFFYKNVVVR